jgi:hypothetical protein|tara:strand:- start:20 stop:241 length:222 start_codon:yes stop_codon:yes gene_type:complete
MSVSISFVAVIVSMFAIAIFAIVRTSKSSGKAESIADSLKEGEERREAFDDETSKPIQYGDDLISRLRKRVGR